LAAYPTFPLTWTRDDPFRDVASTNAVPRSWVVPLKGSLSPADSFTMPLVSENIEATTLLEEEVLREALASGRPVVATRVGDVDEVIRHREHGLIVSPGAQEEMAAAILELLRNRELAANCARDGLQLARKEFGFDRMMQHKLQVDTQVVTLHRDPVSGTSANAAHARLH